MLSSMTKLCIGAHAAIDANDLLISAEVENLLGHVVFIVGVGAKLRDLAISQLDLHCAEGFLIPAEQNLANVLTLL